MGVSPGSKWASQFQMLDEDDVDMAREKCVIIVHENALAGLGDIQSAIRELAKLARQANQMRQDEVREAEAAFEAHRNSVRDEEAIALGKKDEKDALLRQIHGAAFGKYERRLLNSRSSYNSAMLLFETRARALCTSSLCIRTSKTCACWGIYHEDVLVMDVCKGKCRFVFLGTVCGCEVYRHLGNNLEYIKDQYGAFTRRYLIRCLEDGEYESLFTVGLPCKTLLRDREPAVKLAEREAKTSIMRALSSEQKRVMATSVDAALQRKLRKWTGNTPSAKVENPTLEPLVRKALKGTETKAIAPPINSWKCKIQGAALCQEWLALPQNVRAEAMYWHVREGSTKGSYLISFACTKHPIFGSTGLPFHRLEKGLAIIDAARLPCAVIDVHAPTTTVALGQLLQVTEPQDWRVGKPAAHHLAGANKRTLNLTGKVNVASKDPWERTVRDFLRTREVLVAVNVPVDAVVCRCINSSAWQHNPAYKRGKIERPSPTTPLEVEPKDPEFGSIVEKPQQNVTCSVDEDLMQILSRHFGGHFG